MNSTHTPGPWKPYPARNGSCLEICDDDGAPVAAITPQLRDEESANAFLIAAAPDLLAALRDLVAAVDNPDEDSLFELAAARAAIARATGERQ